MVPEVAQIAFDPTHCPGCAKHYFAGVKDTTKPNPDGADAASSIVAGIAWALTVVVVAAVVAWVKR